jgi:hypothetical protein
VQVYLMGNGSQWKVEDAVGISVDGVEVGLMNQRNGIVLGTNCYWAWM